MPRIIVRTLVLTLCLMGTSASAHDPSAYGGLFRSRDLGGVWLNADVGLFLSAALTVAVDPRDPNDLLMGTDLGLMRSRSGGRSWSTEAQDLITGAVFALAFSPDGTSALCAAPSGVFRLDDGRWTGAAAPDGAAPARAIGFGAAPGRVYLLGRDGLFASGDGGLTYGSVAVDAPSGGTEITALAVTTQPRELLLAVVGGRLVASEDGGRHWSGRAVGLDDGAPVDTVVPDPSSPVRLWAAQADRVYVSDDSGLAWHAVGQPLPESGTIVRGIAADPTATRLIVATHRGLYRSDDGGQSWAFLDANLPAHLEAGPLVRAPSDTRTVYAVFSLMPYAEVWRTALEGGNLLARADPVSLAGGLAFVLLVIIGGVLLACWLAGLRATESSARRAPS